MTFGAQMTVGQRNPHMSCSNIVHVTFSVQGACTAGVGNPTVVPVPRPDLHMFSWTCEHAFQCTLYYSQEACKKAGRWSIRTILHAYKCIQILLPLKSHFPPCSHSCTRVCTDCLLNRSRFHNVFFPLSISYVYIK